MVVGDNKRTNIMDGIENTGDVRLHDHRLRLKQRFDIVRKLGQGTYGKVQLGINKKTGQEVAIKTIKKCKIESEADLVRIRREVQIMSSVRHPNIVHIYEVFENSEKMILVMEYCSGGELYDHLSQKKVLPEDEARRLFRQIATAVYYCHIHKICHRDLKLENVLLDETGSAKIADFGLSNVFKETSLLATFCGSPLYASPEIVKGTPYIGPEVDCWSLGVLLYTLVYGAMPFDGSNFKRLVRQISNGDYYEPKTPSSASPLIRDMLTVDAVKRADITYICDHPWVNLGYDTSCLEMSEALAAQTPVRLDLLLSLAPAAPTNSNSVVVPSEHGEMGPEESCTDLTSSASMMNVEPSNSAEKRILDLVAEGGEDAIKPSPTRTLVSCGENKRKLEQAMSASGLHRKKERAASCASIASQMPVPEEGVAELPDDDETLEGESSTPTPPPTLKSSATIIIQPSPPPATPAAPSTPSAPVKLTKDPTMTIKEKDAPNDAKEEEKTGAKPRVSNATRTFNSVKKTSPKSPEEKASPEKQKETEEEQKPNSVSSAAEKLTSLSLTQPQPLPMATNQTTAAPKPKKLSIPGGNVGSFKEQFERRASLTNTNSPEVKKPVPKPVVSKMAKPKAQSEDRDIPFKAQDNGSVRLQQIGVEPSATPVEEQQTLGLNRGGVKKTESEPTHGTTAVDPSVLLQDARRSLQNSMAKLVEEKAGEESRRRAARDIISSAIRTGKPPTAYGRSSSAGVTSLSSLASPPATPAVSAAPRVFRTEAQHRVEDHRNRGVSVERIIPINLSDDSPTSPPAPQPKPVPAAAARVAHTPLRRLVSNESSTSEACSSPGEPIKKSAREFIIPIAVEGKGYVTPRQQSLEPETSSTSRLARTTKPRRISIVSGGESEEEDDTHMHRLRSSRAARAESVSSGEEDEEEEGFHLLTAENLFSTLLHRVRALTNRLNGEEGPGFSQRPHSLFNNLHQSPFFNSPHLPRRNLLREGWGTRDMHADFDSMFNKTRAPLPRGSSKKGKHCKRQEESVGPSEVDGEGEGEGGELSEAELSGIELSAAEARALSALTPALARRLQQRLLANLPPTLPPHAARHLRRTLSLHAPRLPSAPARSHSATDHAVTPDTSAVTPDPDPVTEDLQATSADCSLKDDMELPAPQFCTLPRLRRHATVSREQTPSETDTSRTSRTPERPLLSKYLTPERSLASDDAFDTTTILSEPSYIAAYGGPRHHSHSLRRHQPRKRISRFLRSDFFDTPPDENLYAKHKKEKELETQKILREIREKKNRSLDSGVRSPVESVDTSLSQTDEFALPRKCLSPISAITSLAGKERSRSTTPFYPMLDNIKETNLDTSHRTESNRHGKSDQRNIKNETEADKDSKLLRPKSYPVKSLTDSFDEPSASLESENPSSKESDSKDKSASKESKLVRPKSYPTSSESPEKVYINRNSKKDSTRHTTQKEDSASAEKPEIEVSFSVKLPKKPKAVVSNKTDTFRKSKSLDNNDETLPTNSSRKTSDAILVLKKFQVVNDNDEGKAKVKEHKAENGCALSNGAVDNTKQEATCEETKFKVTNHTNKPEEVKLKTTNAEPSEKKGTIKKKIIRKVSSKSKANVATGPEDNETKPITEKKKVSKKVKEKSTEDGAKPTTVTKKKSVLQSIGHKFEKFTSNKSSSPEKAVVQPSVTSSENKKESKESKPNRTVREQSLPVGAEPPTESSLIKRAVTLTDVAVLDTPQATPSKTTVSKVLGLFRKFEPKEKVPKPIVEKSNSDNMEPLTENNYKSEVSSESVADSIDDKPKRPTSLLLNGLGRKTKYGRAASDGVTTISIDAEDQSGLKKDKHLRNSLKLDFSRLPRVKKIVPTNPVIEPQIMIVSDEKDDSKKDASEKSETVKDLDVKVKLSADSTDTLSHSRSRSRSSFSNSELKSDNSAEARSYDRRPFSPENSVRHPLRNHESTTPDKEDVVERIRRKSFYTRFNEKRQRRKSNLVGPGATDYDPLSRIHSPPIENKFDKSPTPPVSYDLSPGYSVASDISPSTERYRTILNDLPGARGNNRYDNYGLSDKIDTYRSLDRNEFRKYPTRSYLDYDQPSSYTSHRYSRTKSLLDSCEGNEDHVTNPHKYNRTISMYSPGSYATYRPKRTTLNSAIILKENDKEPSPENILEKIRQRKKLNSISRKQDPETDPLARSELSSKSEGYSAECPEKVD